MLPFSHRDNRRIGSRIKEEISSWKRLILSDPNTRNLCLFLLLNFSFAFVELLYGIWSNSLGLKSDSIHMFFDCSSLMIGVAASVITKWRANDRFSYGYVRAEVLAGFLIGASLVFIAVFHIFHPAVERLIEPPEVKHEKLFVVSMIGLFVNLIGIYAFQHGHGHSHGGHGHSHSGHGHSHNHANHNHRINAGPGNTQLGINMEHNHNHSHNHDHHEIERDSTLSPSNSQITKGVFLHILADTLGSVGVIISSILMQYGWMIADPICSMFIAVMIIASVLPLLKESWVILMQRRPVALDHVLPECYNKVKQLPGVYSVQEPHFWTLCSEVYVGALKLEVARTVDPKYVVAHTEMIFHAVGVKNLTVQLDYTM